MPGLSRGGGVDAIVAAKDMDDFLDSNMDKCVCMDNIFIFIESYY